MTDYCPSGPWSQIDLPMKMHLFLGGRWLCIRIDFSLSKESAPTVFYRHWFKLGSCNFFFLNQVAPKCYMILRGVKYHLYHYKNTRGDNPKVVF